MNGGSFMLIQLYELGIGIAAGVLGGCAFCVYRCTAGKFSRKPGMRRRFLLRDAMFSLGVILIWLGIWFSFTEGSLRIMVFVWLAAGIVLFMLFLRKPLEKVLRRIPGCKKRSRKKKPLNSSGQRENRALDGIAAGLYRTAKAMSGKCRDAEKRIRKKPGTGRNTAVDEEKDTGN